VNVRVAPLRQSWPTVARRPLPGHVGTTCHQKPKSPPQRMPGGLVGEGPDATWY